MEQQNQFDIAHEAAAHVLTDAAQSPIKVGNRAYALATLESWAEAGNRPAPPYDAAAVTVQSVPERFAPGYLDLLG